MKVEEIKAKYPNPTKQKKPGHYCVGGALMLATGATGADDLDDWFDMWPLGVFPDTFHILKALMKANPRLDTGQARLYAKSIIGANDRGDFERAWGILGEALAAEGGDQ